MEDEFERFVGKRLRDLLDHISDQVGDIGISLDLIDHDPVRMRSSVTFSQRCVHDVVDVLAYDAP